MSETTTSTTTEAKRIRPTGTKLLVLREDAKDRSKGGIIIPDNSKGKSRMGKVIEAGPGKELDNGKWVKPSPAAGDRILFSEYSGTEVKMKGVSYLIIEDGDVLAIIDEGGEVE